MIKLHASHMRIELNEYKKFVNQISNNHSDKVDLLKEKINKDLDCNLEMTSSTDDELLSLTTDSYRYLYNPMLLHIYAFFEHWLKKFCVIDQQKNIYTNIQVSDLAGRNYIEKSRLYFEKVAKINLSELDEDWKRIQKIQRMRNLITHNNSNIYKNYKRNIEGEFYSFLESNDYIELDEKSGVFYIRDKQFILDEITVMERYLDTIIEKLSVTKVIARNSICPYEMDTWGVEKTERMIKTIIYDLNSIDEYRVRTDEFVLDDALHNLNGGLRTILWNVTKLHAFFKGYKWNPSDVDYIMKERILQKRD